MARAIWTGALSFGLVHIPVEVHTAVRENRPRFRMLHGKDKSPIKMQRICQKDGHAVGWDDLVKGYEYEKGRFVVLTKEDLTAAALEKNRRIEILDFVEAEAVDDRYFETPYYLVPGKGGDMAYALLKEAIHGAKRIGIAKFIMREVQHLAAVEVVDKALVLSTMRFSDELIDVESLRLPRQPTLHKKELEMAKALVNSLAAEWNPEKYTDDYRDNLMKVIRAKMKGKEARLTADEMPRDAKVVNLMERLRESLDAANKGGRAAKAKTNRPQAGRKKSAGKRRRAA